MPITIHAKGKLLITGEYFVLDGAKALAVPTKFGQSFEFSPSQIMQISWEGYDDLGHCWMKELIDLPLDPKVVPATSPKNRLIQVLQQIQALNSNVLNKGWKVTTRLEFPRDWGLGSSSTMIYAMAQWSNVDPYALLQTTFGGSGYDIACAGAESAVLYTVSERDVPVAWMPDFCDQLYFVHLNQKQNSREGIQHYREAKFDKTAVINKLDAITAALQECHDLTTFEGLLRRHEQVVGEALTLPLVPEALFPDYWGAAKSLGAWGGDFVLVTSDRSREETLKYFRGRGYSTVLGWRKMCL